MSDRPIKTRLLALARKTLDESSPEPERVTSGNMLAREVIKLLESGNLDTKQMSSDQAVEDLIRRARETVERTVATAVAVSESKVDPESPSTWVEFDPPAKPPATVGGRFDDNAFGRKPKRSR